MLLRCFSISIHSMYGRIMTVYEATTSAEYSGKTEFERFDNAAR